MDETAGPPRTADVAAMGGEGDEAASSPKMRTLDDDESRAAPPGPPDDVPPADNAECRDPGSIRAASPGPRAVAAAATTTTTTTTTTPQQQQQSLPPQLPAPQPGCGCVAAADRDEITVCITPTTGGQFELAVDRNDSVESLKKIISKKLKVAKERICLLHRERFFAERDERQMQTRGRIERAERCKEHKRIRRNSSRNSSAPKHSRDNSRCLSR